MAAKAFWRFTIDAYRPAYRDKFASDPAGWTSAYDLMVKAKIIEPMPAPIVLYRRHTQTRIWLNAA